MFHGNFFFGLLLFKGYELKFKEIKLMNIKVCATTNQKIKLEFFMWWNNKNEFHVPWFFCCCKNYELKAKFYDLKNYKFPPKSNPPKINKLYKIKLTMCTNKVRIDDGTAWFICCCTIHIICWNIIAHCLLRCYRCRISIRAWITNFIWICAVTICATHERIKKMKINES